MSSCCAVASCSIVADANVVVVDNGRGCVVVAAVGVWATDVAGIVAPGNEVLVDEVDDDVDELDDVEPPGIDVAERGVVVVTTIGRMVVMLFTAVVVVAATDVDVATTGRTVVDVLDVVLVVNVGLRSVVVVVVRLGRTDVVDEVAVAAGTDVVVDVGVVDGTVVVVVVVVPESGLPPPFPPLSPPLVDETLFVTEVAASDAASLPTESCTALASFPTVGSVYATVTT